MPTDYFDERHASSSDRPCCILSHHLKTTVQIVKGTPPIEFCKMHQSQTIHDIRDSFTIVAKLLIYVVESYSEQFLCPGEIVQEQVQHAEFHARLCQFWMARPKP